MHKSWFQLAVGILAMIAIANLQYGWTLFVDPLQQKFGCLFADLRGALIDGAERHR